MIAVAMIVAIVLSALTGWYSSRYYERGLRAEERRACIDTNLARSSQNEANHKTQRFLQIARRARERAAATETGPRKVADLVAAAEYGDLAASYRQIPLRRDC